MSNIKSIISKLRKYQLDNEKLSETIAMLAKNPKELALVCRELDNHEDLADIREILILHKALNSLNDTYMFFENPEKITEDRLIYILKRLTRENKEKSIENIMAPFFNISKEDIEYKLELTLKRYKTTSFEELLLIKENKQKNKLKKKVSEHIKKRLKHYFNGKIFKEKKEMLNKKD
jgi:hypothetical protein